MSDAARAFLAEFDSKRAVVAGGVEPVFHSPRVRRQAASDAASLTPIGQRRVVSRKRTEAKGRALQLLARDYFLSLGYLVQVTQKKVLWIPDAKLGRRPIARNQDMFGCWDLAVVRAHEEGRTVFFVQVTTLSNVSGHRSKILDATFPAMPDDLLLAHEGGRRFRVLRGPLFAMSDERVEVPR